MPKPIRWLLSLWYCRFLRDHDWHRYGVGKPYGWSVCSLCGARVEWANPDNEAFR